MDTTARAWELAMVLIASGKIPFDPANMAGSIHILARYVQELKEALQGADATPETTA
ncbi:hypothetical protein [Pseudomonas sp. W2I6]|jgi:hypothetical protein|uniref:hypothetical protein n=1 Tax=Pseudomonas sp. W2I6 TaxID=3042289 RepID=UPI0027888BB8|nr:hypothetical protein [Pseudomonas sp. W2I6]MDQ0668358.1 hypothetical protein [Pseudomonas sp. W2I6]